MIRPDWPHLYRDCGGAPARSQELVTVTRHTLEIAKTALRQQNSNEAYHTTIAAEHEIDEALA